MKRILFTLSIACCLMNYIYGQKWTYSSGGNAFDGKYKTSSIVGHGSEPPYTKPVFVVNIFNDEQLNIYISKAGYAGCDNKFALMNFDNSDSIYTFGINTNAAKDVWFFEEDDSNTTLSLTELLKKLKLHNTLHVRLISDCGKNDFKFSLSGSSVAIDFVTAGYVSTQIRMLAEMQKEEARKNRIIEMISTGGTFVTKAKYNVSVLYEPKSSSFYKNITLIQGESIVFSNYSKDSEFCILKKASTQELPCDSTFYISRYGVDLEHIIKGDK